MAVDKLVDSAQLDSDLGDIAIAIRTKGGTSAQLTFPSGFISAIEAITTGITPTGTINITQSGNTDVTNYATANVASGSASTPATSITANPTISVSSSGLITASVSGSKSVTPSVSAGYVSSGTAGTVTVSGSNTQQLTTQSAQTITPTTTNQTIASGKYLTGVQTILGDANLIAENIKKNVQLFGITGSYEGGGGGLQIYSSTDWDGSDFSLPQGIIESDLASNVKAINFKNLLLDFNESTDSITFSNIGSYYDAINNSLMVGGMVEGGSGDFYLFAIVLLYYNGGFVLSDCYAYSLGQADFVQLIISSLGSVDFIK